MSVPREETLTKALACLKHPRFCCILWFNMGNYILICDCSSHFPAIYIPLYLPNNCWFLFVCFAVVVKAVSHFVAQADLKHYGFQVGFKLSVILLPLPPKSWNFSYESPHLSPNNILKLPFKWPYFLNSGTPIYKNGYHMLLPSWPVLINLRHTFQCFFYAAIHLH